MIKIPKEFFPKFECDLIRLGNQYDGGYVVSKQSVENSKQLISFGLSNDWSFESSYSSMTNNNIYCYDLSVTNFFWLKDFIKTLIRIIFFPKTNKNLKNLFNFFFYKSFFRKKKNFHIKKFIFPKNYKKNFYPQEKITDLNEILEKISGRFYLKIDIEGAEYRILEQIVKHQNSIDGLSIEFHDFDIHLNLVKKFVNDLDLEIVHIHVNNYGLLNKESIPSVVEFSFAKKDFVDLKTANLKSYPLELDKPCNTRYKDDPVNFY